MLLYLGTAASCYNELSTNFINYCHDIVDKLGLFGDPEEVCHNISTSDVRKMRGRAFTAWGIFHKFVLRSFVYHDHIMTSPPRYPIPGDHGVLAYTTDGPVYHRLPGYMGSTFTQSCKSWLIANTIVLPFLYSRLQGFKDIRNVETAETVYHRLLAWSDDSGIALVEGGGYAHHVGVLHIYYHCTILELFRPFLESGTSLKSFGASRSTPQDIFTASVKQLRRHLIMHPLIHPSARYSVFWHYTMVHVANACLSDLRNPECMFYFLLCLRGFLNLSASFPIMTNISRGFMGAAMRKEVITIPDVLLLKPSQEPVGTYEEVEGVRDPMFVYPLISVTADRKSLGIREKDDDD